MWTGSTVPSANWALCDGTTYGSITTPDLRNRFILGSGTNPVNTTGGSTTITTNNLPAHNHAININDPGHTHGVTDPGHTHGVSDPGHSHTEQLFFSTTSVNVSNIAPLVSAASGNNIPQPTTTNPTGITINSTAVGISINNNFTSISATSQNTGGGQPYLPPYYVLAFIMRIS
jgi:hypothetical protein